MTWVKGMIAWCKANGGKCGQCVQCERLIREPKKVNK